MNATTTFFDWFLFHGLNGLGGWFIFFLIALTAVIWLYYDSASRHLPAMGWRLGISLAALLVLPVALYRFTVNDITNPTASPLGPFAEEIFYLGVLGGVLPVVLAIGYYISYQGLVACPQGHVYEAALGKCPHPDHLPPPADAFLQPKSNSQIPDSSEETVPPAHSLKKRANAWLITTDDRKNFQLYIDETKIGRSTRNDIVLEGDRTVSRESAKIIEQNGHFRLYPLNPGRYPRLNNYAVRQPTLIEADDEIQFGEDTILRFVTSR